MNLPPPPVVLTVHEPEPDDREPKVRPPSGVFDRLKVTILIAVFFVMAALYEQNQVPIMSFGDALRDQLRAKWWLLVLLGIELVRQVHYLVSEHHAGWHQFWQRRVFGGWERRMSRLNPWTRFRLQRQVKWIAFLVIAGFVLAWKWNLTWIEAVGQAPGRIFDNLFTNPVIGLPFAFTLLISALYGLFNLLIFFGIFFIGGVDTFKPGEVKTRFRDVWGQDNVLVKVKESIDFLDRPDEIEAKGGYVPGGILLWGPPGTGKTLMAEAMAGETGKPYVFVDPQAFVQTFLGVAPMKIKFLYRKLRKLALRNGGVIVFFDEADVLGNRGALAQGGFDRQVMNERFEHVRWLSEPSQDVVVHGLFARSTAFTGDEAPRRIRDRIIMGGMGAGGMGTLQALLTEMSGLRKPRGFFSRRIRSFLNIKPKQPPKYRILHVFATNMPNALDEAMLRPGRIDRIYKVGYPSKEGRRRTYQGYLSKIRHCLSDDQVERLSVMTPYATGATIKDLVNEALISAVRDGRDVVNWNDMIRAKHLKDLGLPEDVEYIERERHAIAIHEACHAVAAYVVRQHWAIDLATIEKGGSYLGMVASVKPEDQFTRWRTEYEADIIVSLASLAGERLFFGGDNSSGVSGDLEAATTIASMMETAWGMGSTIAAERVARELLGGGGAGGGPPRPDDEDLAHVRIPALGVRVEGNLRGLFERAQALLEEHRTMVLAIAHALETHKTISGDDVAAIMEDRQGDLVDGRVYHTPHFAEVAEHYHALAAEAHRHHARVSAPLPQLPAYAEPLAVTAGGNGVHVPAPALVPPPPLAAPGASATPAPWAPPVPPAGGRP